LKEETAMDLVMQRAEDKMRNKKSLVFTLKE